MEKIDESKPYSQQTDEQLVALYRQGHRDAFVELMERYRQVLFRFLYRFTGNAATAEDIFQDAFLQIHLWANRFDVERRLKPWIFTIAANKARDYLRKNKRMPGLSLDAPIGGETGGGGSGENSGGGCFVDLLESDFDSPHDVLAKADQRQWVMTVIDSLPDHQREVLLLSYFEQMAYKDIAEVLGVPLGTIKSRLHAAVANFAKQWKGRFQATS